MKCFMSEKECDCRRSQKPLQVFVISPFGYPFDDIYEKGIKNILNEIEPPGLHGVTLNAVRADQAPQLGFVMCQKICQQIQESEFVIADISKPNPNVFYELGLSYGMNKKII
ncbi:MAG TPA: hypothetical protein VK186_14195, partial [Candidatus Deferrimicrobium sp.]|nr:hypothetical protein [Candidatus Deferrimicrobium sp.]